MEEKNLHTKKIETGFKIPDGYFEKFENNLMSKITKEKNEPKVVSLFHRKQVWISAIAACFMLFLAIPIYFNSNETIETSALESYLSSEYSTYDLLENLSIDDINGLETEINVSNESVEEYLLDTQNLDYYLNE